MPVNLTEAAKTLRKNSTDAERLLWSRLKARQLDGMKFRRQEQIGRFIADFVCYESNLIVEADGSQHALNKVRDDERTSWLNSQGFRVLRFWNNEIVANMEGVIETIRQHCSPPLPDPLPPGERESESSSGRHLHVACAIIERDGLVLAARRSAAMSLPLKWEFPGGKIDPGESPEGCLRRELLEELGLQVVPQQKLPFHTHHYPDFTVTLHPFVCTIVSGEIVLHEHAAVAWLPAGELLSLDWAAADYPVIDGYLLTIGQGGGK